MFNLVKDEFEENSDDVLASINKMLEQTDKKEKENKDKENKNI